ncbi:SDR family oxidoreductase [Photobacterium damselae]|uniref:SDR family oxidoreductase n=1 Tax=Photobacterium damselae TaxID=38293 RepID=UPI0040691E53
MKYSLITCSNSCIAKSIISELKKNDYAVTLATRTPIDNEYQLDLFDKESISNVISLFISSKKQFDSFVFILPRIPPSTNIFPTTEQWNDTFDKYFIKPMFFLSELINNKILNDNAKIVMISGISSKFAMPCYSVNNVIRSAWVGQFKTLSLSFSSMSFNTVSLGGVLTESYVSKLKQKAYEGGRTYEEQLTDEVSNVPMKKYATPQEVAQVVVPLCGSFASHMTGQNIVLDGGFIRAYA